MKALVAFLLGLSVCIVAACSGNDAADEAMPTPRTDALRLDLDYEGKSYLIDGVGKAVLATCEDGDTAEFIVDDEQIRVRFLGVDTPEASHYYEPWGVQATDFVCGRLAEADTIVLERDFDGPLRDTYGRYLAFIWYDGRLINLELVEKAYSMAQGTINLKYGTDMMDAWFELQGSGKRIYGEEDPMFDYAQTGIDVTLTELLKTPEDYDFRVVNVEGIVTAKMGIHPFIELDGAGMFMYIGHNPSSALEIGNRVRFERVRFVYDLKRYGGWHLADFPKADVTVLETDSPIDIPTITFDHIDASMLGRTVHFQSLTIETIETNIDGSFFMRVRDHEGTTMRVHHSRHILHDARVQPDDFTTGDIVNITVSLRNSPEGTELMLTDKANIHMVD